MDPKSPVRTLTNQYRDGSISRRHFVQRASALGLGTAMVVFLANTLSPVSAQESTQNEAPSVGTENQTRGEGGELNLLQWQAPTSLSPHVVGGTKDWLGAIPVMEPVIHYGTEAELIPNLITEIPSFENGGLSEDLTSVTFNVLPDVTWSDGEPFTAADIGFTIDWVLDPDNGARSFLTYSEIDHYEVIDDLTITVHFTQPNPFWATPFSGTAMGFVYPRHILENGDHDAFMSKPIGTGPYKVDSFVPDDSVLYSMNENYRHPNKPYYSSISLKGGGDAPAAARAVIQTGEFDYAWNLQVEPDILNSIIGDGSGAGEVLPFPGVAAEKLNMNFSDPRAEVDGQRSEMNTPHPILSSHAVRGAIATGIDRQLIADEFYGFGQSPNANLLVGDPATESTSTSWSFDLEAAAQLLEDDGWVLDGDVRKKDGMELRLDFATSINSVRQKTQAVIKASLEQIGFRIELIEIDAAIFFDSAVGNEQNALHHYWDLSEQQNNPESPRPLRYMMLWYAGENGSNIAQRSNSWSGANWVRYNNPDYDAALDAATVETDPQRLAELFVEMNDILINDHAVVPLVIRGSTAAVNKKLNKDNIAAAPFSYDYWNIANWNEAE